MLTQVARRTRHSSRYKGVCWETRKRRWRAYVTVDGVSRHLGYFNSETDAACAYDRAALAEYAEFAKLNFPLCEIAQSQAPGSRSTRAGGVQDVAVNAARGVVAINRQSTTPPSVECAKWGA